MHLVFDTETTGFVRKDLAPTERGQARIVQLAWLLLDESFQEVESFCSLIKCNGQWEIHPGAAEKTGHTVELCDKEGIDIKEAMRQYELAWQKSKVRVAHNIEFDLQLINIEDIHLGNPCRNWLGGSVFCTMKHMTPLCKLKGRWPGKWKWPKLQEAYEYCFKTQFDGAHDALADVRATAKIYKWIKGVKE